MKTCLTMEDRSPQVVPPLIYVGSPLPSSRAVACNELNESRSIKPLRGYQMVYQKILATPYRRLTEENWRNFTPPSEKTAAVYTSSSATCHVNAVHHGTHVFVHAITLGVDDFRDTNLRYLDTTCQAGASVYPGDQYAQDSSSLDLRITI